MREITRHIAIAVVREANEQGLGTAIPDERIESAVSDMMWYPEYPTVEPA